MVLSSLFPWLPAVCSTCSVSCRRWLIWKVWKPSCPWATASCSLGIPTGLSHFKKLFGGCFYPALLPHSFSEYFALFTKAKGLLGSFCHSIWPTACSFVGTESLVPFFWRTRCIRSFCFDSILHSEVWLQCVCLFTACLPCQTSANKPAPGSDSAMCSVVHKIARKSVWIEIAGNVISYFLWEIIPMRNNFLFPMRKIPYFEGIFLNPGKPLLWCKGRTSLAI